MIDPNHPLHRASFFVEDAKWPEGWRDDTPPVTLQDEDAYREILARFLAAAEAHGGPHLDPEELRKAILYYGESFHHQLGGRLPEFVATSIFSDGVLHGYALALGLSADPPPAYTKPPDERY